MRDVIPGTLISTSSLLPLSSSSSIISSHRENMRPRSVLGLPAGLAGVASSFQRLTRRLPGRDQTSEKVGARAAKGREAFAFRFGLGRRRSLRLFSFRLLLEDVPELGHLGGTALQGLFQSFEKRIDL